MNETDITKSLGPVLSGLRILELGHFIAAPFCTRVLADLGADVIKVEPPGRGDPVRSWGEMVNGKSLWWSVHGRNKRCVTLNLKHPEARKHVLKLTSSCDVVVENFRPGHLEKWDLGPKDLEKMRSGLVIVRISGYGQTGPDKGRSAFGVIGEAKGGLRYLCAHPQEVSDLPPVRVGVSLGDSVAGLYGAIGALVALLGQRSSGNERARVIDVSLNESVLSLLEGCLPEYGHLGNVRQPTGSTLPTNAPSNSYRCADGNWVLIAANSDSLFRDFSQAIGKPELADDPKFSGNPGRVAHAKELDALIGAWAGSVSINEALEQMDAVNIPATKIYSIADCASDQQYLDRDMILEVDDPIFGKVLHPGVVPLVDGMDRAAAIRWPGPEVGAHNKEVYGNLLGYTEDDLEKMLGSGLI